MVKINRQKSALTFKDGCRHGMPICTGYFLVAVSFGIFAVKTGDLLWWQAVLISMTNLTSAGQFAGVGIISALGSSIEMALCQIIINLRYSLMSIVISNKSDSSISFPFRWLLGFGITDEIFAIAATSEQKINRKYLFGLILLPYIGWSLGTLCGATLSNVIPSVIANSMTIAIYAMFVAIVFPQAKRVPSIFKVVIIAAVLSVALKFIPIFNFLSDGMIIIISSVLSSLFGAIFLPFDQKQASDTEA